MSQKVSSSGRVNPQEVFQDIAGRIALPDYVLGGEPAVDELARLLMEPLPLDLPQRGQLNSIRVEGAAYRRGHFQVDLPELTAAVAGITPENSPFSLNELTLLAQVCKAIQLEAVGSTEWKTAAAKVAPDEQLQTVREKLEILQRQDGSAAPILAGLTYVRFLQETAAQRTS